MAFGAYAQLPGDPAQWKLMFRDEFDGNSLDQSKWSYNYPWGPTHNHRAYCAPENVRVENGTLKIIAENRRHPDAPSGINSDGRWLSLDYTSGAINTKDKFNFTTGYIEARVKLPRTKGFWPAFWTLNASGSWPPEIDIMEHLSHDPGTLHTNYHYGPSWDNKWSYYQTHQVADLSQDYNIIGVEWDKGYMKWYLNGRQLGGTFTDAIWINQSKDMYIILNLAVGGWESDPDGSTQWPGVYECDWVRVWQKAPPFTPGGVYKVIARHSGKALDIAGVSQENGAVAHQWDYVGGANQHWKIDQVEGGYYTLTARHSGKVLDVPGSSTSDGAFLNQWPWLNGDNQKWAIVDVGGGYFRITAKHSGKSLDVAGGGTANGDTVKQYTYWGGANQQWKLEPVSNGRLATDETVAQPSAVVSPNPITQGVVHLTLPGYKGQVSVELIDARGERVYTGKATVVGSAINQPVDQLKPGTYIIKVNSAQEVISRKFVVQ